MGKRARLALVLVVVLLSGGIDDVAHSQIVNSAWNTGAGNWNVAGNWLPVGAPDNGTPVGTTYNVQIGNLPAAANAQVTFVPVSGTSDTILTLAVSANADLFTNGNQLNVLGQSTIDGVGTTVRVDPHATPGTASFQSLDLDLNNGGGLTMAGGIANITALLEINAGSVLGGHGMVNVGDADASLEKAFENSALLQPQGNTAAPQTLTIHANGIDTIDLDGVSETGIVDVDNALANVNADTVSLVIDGPLSDALAGTIQIGQRDTLTFTKDFTVNGAAVSLTGGNAVATLNGAGNITAITGGTFTITGAALIENDMAFNGTTNVITVSANSSLELGGSVVIPDASALVFSASTSQLIISGDTSVIELAGDFNWDGPGSAITTVEGAGTLTVNVSHVDSGNDIYSGTLSLNDNADVSVNTAANSWTMDGAINKNNAGSSTVAGDTVDLTGAITVNAGSLTMPVTTLNPTASIVANGTLLLGADSEFAGPSSVTGTGTLRMVNTSTVTANTTIGVATFDWDGTTTGTLHTINAGVIFTINSTIFDSDGDMDDPISLAGSVAGIGGQLNVNGVANWTMAAALTTNPAAIETATLGGSARMTLSGAGASWAVSGNTTANAPVTFGSSATTISAARTLRLAGGDNNTNTNVMSGGTIGGAGTLAANDARELRGFGTIGAIIDFDDTARLRADDGTLTISGAILDVGVIGTADSDGVLNVTNAWNNNVAAGVALLGGTVQGGTITNDSANGIQGFGTVTARVVNNTQLLSFNSGTLVVQTAGNDNDWDGVGGTGLLRASAGTTLELRDVGAAFGFTGTVRANPGGHVYTNGFALDFNPGSTLDLGGGLYESTSSTDLGGTVTVAAGVGSTIRVADNFFLTCESGSNTTLNGNLRLENNNINIEAGATFSGPGALVIPDGSHLVVDNLGSVGVLMDMQGAFRPGNFEGIGRVNLFDYQQADSGKLYVELKGTALNAFDRLVASGDVAVDGYLNIDIDEISPGVPFVPVLGNTFNIITGNTVTGKFDYVDVSGMPNGLTFHLNYLLNAVQLQVVNTPFFAADFDNDGDVDATDLSIWRGAFNLNQLGDADGDNDSDGADFAIWQREFGSHPSAGAIVTLVPEPATVSLLGMMVAAVSLGFRRLRRSRAIAIAVCGLSILAFANVSCAQSVSLSLNVLYNNPANHAAGGNWQLVAKTSSLNGISYVNAIMSNINVAGISYHSGIGAMLKNGNPFVTNNGASVEVLYAQDLSTPASIVTDVGRGGGTPGNLAIDPLNDASWNNAALIAKGTFGAVTPAFTSNNDSPADVTDANVLTTKIAPFSAVAATPLTMVVRESTLQFGDYNRNGTVDAADYVVWRDTLNTSVSLYSGADGNGSGTVDVDDFSVWAAHFGLIAAPGSALGASVAVPEPVSLTLGLAACLAGLRVRFKRVERLYF